jgi:hypothetical protein
VLASDATLAKPVPSAASPTTQSINHHRFVIVVLGALCGIRCSKCAAHTLAAGLSVVQVRRDTPAQSPRRARFPRQTRCTVHVVDAAETCGSIATPQFCIAIDQRQSAIQSAPIGLAACTHTHFPRQSAPLLVYKHADPAVVAWHVDAAHGSKYLYHQQLLLCTIAIPMSSEVPNVQEPTA